MNILKAIEDNKTKRVALVDVMGKTIESFAVQSLSGLSSFPAHLVSGEYAVIRDKELIIGEALDGTKQIYATKAEAEVAGRIVKIYKEVGE